MMENSSFFLSGLESANGKWELIELIGEGTYGEVRTFSITLLRYIRKHQTTKKMMTRIPKIFFRKKNKTQV